MRHEIKRDDIISFNCTTKLIYKNCEVTAKRYGKHLEIHVSNFSGRGYYAEKADNFITDTIFDDLLDHLNNIKPYIEEIYQKTIEENARNDDNIMDFEEYEK